MLLYTAFLANLRFCKLKKPLSEAYNSISKLHFQCTNQTVIPPNRQTIIKYSQKKPLETHVPLISIYQTSKTKQPADAAHQPLHPTSSPSSNRFNICIKHYRKLFTDFKSLMQYAAHKQMFHLPRVSRLTMHTALRLSAQPYSSSAQNYSSCPSSNETIIPRDAITKHIHTSSGSTFPHMLSTPPTTTKIAHINSDTIYIIVVTSIL